MSIVGIIALRGWTGGNWKEADLHAFVRALIRIRKQYPVFAPAKEMQGVDKTRFCGVPDVSYHGESAWRTPSEVYSRQLGVYYSGDDGDGENGVF